MMRRGCAECGESHLRQDYSSNQWRKGDGVSRCKGCVAAADKANHYDDETEAEADAAAAPVVVVKDSIWLVQKRLEETEVRLEQSRAKDTYQEWRDKAEQTELIFQNLDEENMNCPFCQVYMPLNGTSYYNGDHGDDDDKKKEKKGLPVFHERLYCCGTRCCIPCGNRRFKKIKEAPAGKEEQSTIVDCQCPVCHKTIPTQVGYAEILHYAKEGKAWANAHIGGVHKYQRKDIRTALAYYIVASQKGNIDAQMAIAEAYMFGQGPIQKDGHLASVWMQKAADQGDRSSQFFMGTFFHPSYSGDYIKVCDRDLSRSLYYWTLAAYQGHAEAQCRLAEYFLKCHHEEGGRDIIFGSKMTQDRAIYWFEQAAKQGHEEARMRLQHERRWKKTQDDYYRSLLV